MPGDGLGGEARLQEGQREGGKEGGRKGGREEEREKEGALTMHYRSHIVLSTYMHDLCHSIEYDKVGLNV